MSRKVLFVSCFFFSINCFSAFSQSKDTILKKEYKFIIHHEILSPVIYQLAIGGNNNHTRVFAWKYFTGGFGYNVSNKYELRLDYLFFEKQINSTEISLDAPAIFGSVVNSNSSYWAQHHLYKQKYIWLSLRRNFKKFYFSLGLGIGSNSYDNDYKYNSVNEKSKDWCNVIDFGYKIRFTKRLSLTPYIGLLTAFSYKKEIVYQNPVLYQASDVYDYEIKSDKDLKKVEIENTNKVIRSYKYFGIMQSKFIPRLGLSISYMF